MPVSTSMDGSGIALLTLDLGRGGLIAPSFVGDLHAALDEVERVDARAVVVTGTGRVFCSALDLAAVETFGRPEMERFVDALDGLFRRVLACPRPLVAAVNGHAIAGGCVLAMACDLRVMADGPFHIGANEVQFGVPLPAAAFEILCHAAPGYVLSASLLQGKLYSPAEARRDGLVHRLAGERGTVADALDEARLFAAAEPSAQRALKADLKAPVLARIDAAREARRARFLDAWFGPAQPRLQAVREKLSGRRTPDAG
jgi:enoyl-CoA hydratase